MFIQLYYYWNTLTQWSRVLLEKLIVIELVKKFPVFIEPEGS